MQANIPVHLFEIDTLTPGITVFGLAFMTLFSATLIAKDRESALLQRLYTTPLTGFDFIIGYMLPFVHAAELEKALFDGNAEAAAHILPVVLYAVFMTVLAVFCFLGQMKKQ